MTKNNNTSRVMLAVFWILILFVGYYWSHKPFTAQTALTIGKSLLDISLVMLMIISSGALGRKFIRANSLSWSERVVLQAAAGMGLFAIIWLVLGLLSLYSPITAWIILVGSLLVNYKACRGWLTEWGNIQAGWESLRSIDRILLLLVTCGIFLQIIIALAPPLKYDALSYHLQLPRIYRETGRFVFTQDNPYWGHPQLGEMLFTWMLLLFRSQTAALLNTFWGILLLIGLSGTAQRLTTGMRVDDNRNEKPNALEIHAGLIPTIALIAGMTFRYLLGWAYVDLITALFGWAAFVSIISALDLKNLKLQNWAGIFLGFAIGTKWTAGILALSMFLFILVSQAKSRRMFRDVLIAAAFMLLAAAPWLVKNFVYTGNPLYPYLIPTKWVDAIRLEAASRGGEQTSLLQYIFLPFTSTWFGWDGAEGFGADIGPLMVLLAIPGLWSIRKKDFGKLILLSAAFCWLAMLLGGSIFNHLQQVRLYFVFFPLLALSSVFGWIFFSRLNLPFLRVSRILTVFLLLVLVFTTVMDITHSTNLSPMSVILGNETEENYLERGLGWYAPTMQFLSQMGEETKVLMLWEARGYYAPISTTADPWIDNFRVAYWEFHEADRILDNWMREGYTHLLYYKSGADRIRIGGSPMDKNGWQTLDVLLAKLPEPQSFGDVYYLYPLKFND